MEDFFKSLPAVLSSAGVAGVVLWYYLTRIIPALESFKRDVWLEVRANRDEMRRLEDAMDRSTKADMLRLISSPHVATQVKESAAAVIADVDAADSARKSLPQLEAPKP